MITEKAVVIAYQAGEVTVECQANQACGGCVSKASCGTAALSELTGKSSRYLFTFPCSRPMRIGENGGNWSAGTILTEISVYCLYHPLICVNFQCVIGKLSVCRRVAEYRVYIRDDRIGICDRKIIESPFAATEKNTNRF